MPSPLCFAIVGCGMIARFHARALAEVPGTHVVALVSRTPANGQKLIAETVSEERTGAAQGIAFFATGFSMAAITLLSGPLYAAFGVDGFFFMAGFAVAGIGLVVLAARSAPERRLGR